MQTLNDFNLVYFTAALAFLFAILFELFLRTWRVRKFHQENPLSDRMEKAVHYFMQNKQRQKITNDIYQKLTKVSDNTAARDLQKLVDLGLLEQRGKTSTTYYLFTRQAESHIESHL